MADGSVKIEVLLDDSKVSGGVKKVEGRLSGLGDTAKRGIGTITKLAGALGLVGLAYKGIDMVKNSLDGAIDRYDTLNNFPRVMEQIGFDAQTSEKAINKLSDGIQGLPTRLDEVASTAQSIAIMTGDLDGAVDTTLALNNAFLASGASAQDASRGLDQYVQMLSKGEVDLQSWRTLQETMPYALRKTAEAFGFTGQSATNDFYDALKSGEITMSEFNAKLIELDQAQGGFAETAQTAAGGIKTAMTNMKTWFVMGVADILEAIDEAMGGVGSIEGAINKLKPIVQGVFGWIANTAIPAVAEAISWAREKFDELSPTIDKVKDALEPLFNVFKETGANLREQLGPTLENLRTLFESLMPIIELLAAFFGGAFMLAIIVWTTALNAAYNAIGPLINALISLADFVVNVVNTIIALLTGDFPAALEFWDAATESSVEFFKNLWDGVVGFFTGAIDTILAWFGILSDDGPATVEELKERVVKFFGEMQDKAIEKATELVANARQKFEEVKQNIVNRVTEAKNNLVSRFTEMVSNVRQKATQIVNTARQKFEDVKRKIREKLTEAVRIVGQKIGEMPGKVVEFVSDMVSAGGDLVQGLIDGIKNMGASAIEAITGVVDGVIDKAKSLLKISSPSRLFEQFGEWVGEGLVDGIDSMQRMAERASEKLGLSVEGAFSPELQLDGLGALKGLTANSVLSGVLPTNFAVQQEVMHKQANANRYDDSRVIELLRELVEKDPNLYVDREKLGSVVDKEQARRIQLLEGWVAID